MKKKKTTRTKKLLGQKRIWLKNLPSYITQYFKFLMKNIWDMQINKKYGSYTGKK